MASNNMPPVGALRLLLPKAPSVVPLPSLPGGSVLAALACESLVFEDEHILQLGRPALEAALGRDVAGLLNGTSPGLLVVGVSRDGVLRGVRASTACRIWCLRS